MAAAIIKEMLWVLLLATETSLINEFRILAAEDAV